MDLFFRLRMLYAESHLRVAQWFVSCFFVLVCVVFGFLCGLALTWNDATVTFGCDLQDDDDCIVPPPEIRLIADKTADFVARNGPEFESRILATNQGNAKFRFLIEGDPYRPYFDIKVRQIRMNLLEEKARAAAPPPPAAAAADTTDAAGASTTADGATDVATATGTAVVPAAGAGAAAGSSGVDAKAQEVRLLRAWGVL